MGSNWKMRCVDNVELGQRRCSKTYIDNMTTNIKKHEHICNELNDLYARKNKDYGNSFSKTFEEEGFAMARIRLMDKLERFKMLSRTSTIEVKDESIRDTLIDLANYAIMTVMEIDFVEAEKVLMEENNND